MGRELELNERAFIAQLEAMRAQIDAILAILLGESPPDEGCSHPPDQRQPVGMGSSDFYCRLCQTLVKGG